MLLVSSIYATYKDIPVTSKDSLDIRFVYSLNILNMSCPVFSLVLLTLVMNACTIKGLCQR